MQTQSFRRAVLGLMALGLTLSALAILSCGGSDDDDGIQRQANLQGANERPVPRSTPGSGTAQLTIDPDKTKIDYVLTYTGLTNVVQAHIHEGDANTAGPIFLFLCANGTLKANAPIPPPDCPAGSTVTVSGTLTAANLITLPNGSPPILTFADACDQILNGNSYTNVHTNDGQGLPDTGPGDFPGGEVRGQNQ
jgi:hypothetical protein